MKFFNLIYVSIYDWYNRMKQNGRSINPSGMVALMFGISIEGWGLLLYSFFYKFFKHNTIIPSSSIVILSMLGIILGGLVNEYYSYKDRSTVIYNNYLSMYSKKNQDKEHNNFF